MTGLRYLLKNEPVSENDSCLLLNDAKNEVVECETKKLEIENLLNLVFAT